MNLSALRLGLLAAFFVMPAAASTGLDVAATETQSRDETSIILKSQVMLDRRGYSPGAIGGTLSPSTRIAIKAFQQDHGFEPTGTVDQLTFALLAASDDAPVLTSYTIEHQDVIGPFADAIPSSIAGMALLKRLDYTGPRELLAERFHMDEDFLARLNPDADFGKAGTKILVAAVEVEMEGRAAASGSRVDRIIVGKNERTVRAFDKNGRLVAFYPASIGGEEHPSPDGEARITRIARVPTWNYTPKLELAGYDELPDQRLTIASGPNNPVGTVWIAVNRPSYGIHGTAEPNGVGESTSSGCIRLTNWDVEELAGFVRRGVSVVFEN
jgi:lipoprotein-anchoring transpeptidase ErfK/SrfK